MTSRYLRKLLLTAGGSFFVGFGGGYLASHLINKKKVADAKHNYELYSDNLETQYYNYYKSWAERRAQQIAKDILMAQAERVASQAPSSASETTETSTDTMDDSEPATGLVEASESVVETHPEADGILVRRNVFDTTPDPTQAVDYSKFVQTTEEQTWDTAERLLQDQRTTTGFARNRSEVRDDLDVKEAEDALDEWYKGHTPDGKPIDSTSDGEDDPGLMDEDEKAIADAEFDKLLYEADGPYKFIDEFGYGRVPSFDQSFIIYCDIDGVWCDEDLKRIEDITSVIGKNWPSVQTFFASGSQVSGDTERVFVRNTIHRTDYEIVVYHRSWEQMVYQAEWPK